MSGSPTIRRGYCNIGDHQAPRYIHYYSCGSGPALLLLHPSPSAGSTFVPILQRLGDHVTAIAIDTPGYGLSDPLPCAVDSLEPYVDALEALRQALGIPNMFLYGSATGSQIVVEYAKKYPQFCKAAVLDNVADFPLAVFEDVIQNYFPDMSVDPCGAHLNRIWGMALDLMRFFPWHKRDDAGRLPARNIDPKILQVMAVQFLQAGADYSKAYRVAFANERADKLLPVRVPTTVIRSSGSIVKVFADRFDNYEWPDNIRMHACGPAIAERQQAIIDVVSDCTAGHESVDIVAPNVRNGRRIVTLEAGDASLLQSEGDGTPWLLLHDIGGSVDGVRGVFHALSDSNRNLVIAPDLPGHGASDAVAPDGRDYLEVCVDWLAAILNELSVETVNVFATRSAAAVAMRLCEQATELVREVVLLDPASGRDLVVSGPRLDGGHLNTIWHSFRNEQLYFVQSDWSSESALSGEPNLDPDAINQKVLDIMRCEPSYAAARQACEAFSVADAITRGIARVRIARTTGTTDADRSVRDLGLPTGTVQADLPAEMTNWCRLLGV